MTARRPAAQVCLTSTRVFLTVFVSLNLSPLFQLAQCPNNAPAPAPAEDEIDWDEDDTKVDAPATTEAASATIAAGGQGAVTTPVAVPNQKRDEIDPAAADDLTVAAAPKLSEEQSSTAIAAAVAAAPAAEVKPAEPEAPKQDFTMGIQQTDAEREAEKRAQRAKRFGIVPDEEEIKKAERAKKFGEGAGAAVNISGLDEALPERKKRGREGREQGGREAKRQTPDRRTEAPRRGEKNNNAAQKQALNQAAAPAPLKKVMKRVLDDPVEKAKAEARLKKFGPPTQAASS